MYSNNISTHFKKSKKSKVFIYLNILLFILIFTNMNLNAQPKAKSESDWQIYLEDSLIISGSHGSYNLLQTSFIKIDESNKVKKLKIIYKNSGAFRSLVEFKEKDTCLFTINGYYAEKPVGDTIVIDSKYHNSELLGLKGRTVKIFYSDDKFQKTPVLLGIINVKSD